MWLRDFKFAHISKWYGSEKATGQFYSVSGEVAQGLVFLSSLPSLSLL